MSGSKAVAHSCHSCSCLEPCWCSSSVEHLFKKNQTTVLIANNFSNYLMDFSLCYKREETIKETHCQRHLHGKVSVAQHPRAILTFLKAVMFKKSQFSHLSWHHIQASRAVCCAVHYEPGAHKHLDICHHHSYISPHAAGCCGKPHSYSCFY